MAKKKHNLVGQFKKTGLDLKILDTPLQSGRGQDQIVQLNVGRKVMGTKRNEWFEIYLGVDNQVQILDTDKPTRQLLLLVKEQSREYEFQQPKSRIKSSNVRTRNELKREGTKFRETESHFVITATTDDRTRLFLMGVDERQLFIAQVRYEKSGIKKRSAKGGGAITTVDQARKALTGEIVLHEGKRRLSNDRQGEWLFLKATPAQVDEIERGIAMTKLFVQCNKNIGEVHGGRRIGKPHKAEEIIKFVGSTNSTLNYPIRQSSVFVRGKIKHDDHPTKTLKHWYEVILNNEGATSSGTSSGVSWID